jgi:hypothetical protein
MHRLFLFHVFQCCNTAEYSVSFESSCHVEYRRAVTKGWMTLRFAKEAVEINRSTHHHHWMSSVAARLPTKQQNKTISRGGASRNIRTKSSHHFAQPPFNIPFLLLLLLLQIQIIIIKMPVEVKDNQCEVVLVGCGAPNRGMGWYHAVQMLRGDIPSAALAYIVEPWFLGAGT